MIEASIWLNLNLTMVLLLIIFSTHQSLQRFSRKIFCVWIFYQTNSLSVFRCFVKHNQADVSHPPTFLEIVNDAVNPTWAAEQHSPYLWGRLWVQSWLACGTGPDKKPCWGKQDKTRDKNESGQKHIFVLLSQHWWVIRSNVAFLGKVGHLFIMERRHLTINHESELRTAQQTKHLLFRASLQTLHSFTGLVQLEFVPFSAHWRQQRTSVFMQRGVYQRGCCKLSSLRLHPI